MDSLYDILEELGAIISLALPALESLSNSKPSDFWFWIVVSVVFAACMYFLMWGLGRLVFKRYKLTVAQHLAWGGCSLLSGAAIMFWVVGQNLAPGLNLLLLFWQGSIKQDQQWAGQTYAACYQAVKDTGKEDFSKSPPPPLGVNTFIPLNSDEAKMAYTRVMMDRTAVHFATDFSALGRLLNVTDGLDTPSSELKAKVNEFFKQAKPDAEGNKTLPRSEAIAMCSDILRENFQSRVGSLETLTLAVSYIMPALAWLGLMTWVLYRSNTDIGNLVARIAPR
jgi:hypothetical protein